MKNIKIRIDDVLQIQVRNLAAAGSFAIHGRGSRGGPAAKASAAAGSRCCRIQIVDLWKGEG